MRKAVKIIGLGIVIWALSLLWPEINRALNDPVLINLGLLLCLVMLIYSLLRYLDYPDNQHRPGQQHIIKPVSKTLPR